MTPRVEAWLLQARDDLAMADYAFTGGFHAQTCYHACQAAEKALKGLLIALGQEPPRTHSLERLVEAAAVAGVDAASFEGLRLNVLSRMASATRYPDGDEAPRDLFDPLDAEQALATAGSVLGCVEGLL
jgi:HEPN domain-containing protein